MNTLQILYLTLNLAASTWFMLPEADQPVRLTNTELLEQQLAIRAQAAIVGRELLKLEQLMKADGQGAGCPSWIDTPQPGLVISIDWTPGYEIGARVGAMKKGEGE